MLEVFFNNLTQVIAISLFVIFIFILGREFVLWYFKINTRIENQNRMIFLLEKLAGKSTKNQKALNVLLNTGTFEKGEKAVKEILDHNALSHENEKSPAEKDSYLKKCAQCGERITENFPIIITERGKTKYFCSDDCRLSNLEIE